jgi:hypothetical protein
LITRRIACARIRFARLVGTELFRVTLARAAQFAQRVMTVRQMHESSSYF